jgi:hypothetical protein
VWTDVRLDIWSAGDLARGITAAGSPPLQVGMKCFHLTAGIVISDTE